MHVYLAPCDQAVFGDGHYLPMKVHIKEKSVDSRILLVSHGLTQWNLDGRIQGHTDTQLNAIGRKMAELLAHRLKRTEIAAIYSSDLKRAVQTAAPVARLTGLPVVQDMRLREGRSIHQETDPRYPLLDYHMAYETEPYVLARMQAVLGDIARANPGVATLVVSHQGAMGLFLWEVITTAGPSGMSYQGRRTAINHLTYAGDRWRCLRLDDDRHLAPIQDDAIHANHG